MDFVAPFGGFKASGIGREFGPEGLDAVHRAEVDLHGATNDVGRAGDLGPSLTIWGVATAQILAYRVPGYPRHTA